MFKSKIEKVYVREIVRDSWSKEFSEINKEFSVLTSFFLLDTNRFPTMLKP